MSTKQPKLESTEYATEYEVRLKKREQILAKGKQPYPAETKRNETIKDCLKNFDGWEKDQKEVVVAGRIRSIRGHGGLSFIGLEDETGLIQIVLKKDHIGEESYNDFFEFIDAGDFIETVGSFFITKRGEKSIDAKIWRLISKTLRPMPEKWHGLKDIEERLRYRYLDLLSNSQEREIFFKKARFWKAVRGYLSDNGFLEVETPVLEMIPGGADAEPFATHHNALDIDLYLRISLELPLKRLIVGGFEKVFEIGRIFRNEGIDREHLQDYTQMEFYWAYADYKILMPFVRELYQAAIRDALGDLKHNWSDQIIDWSGDWPIVEYFEIFKEKTGLDLKIASEKDLIALAKKEGLEPEKHPGKGRVTDLIFKKMVRPNFIQPAFLINPPVEIEPLAKRMEDDPDRVERFQVMACGTELGKGFSELNDPVDQRGRFEEQMKLREIGDAEAQRMDEDFVRALEHGMPPTGGFGVSERLFSIIMNRPIRETIFFPLMRPKT